MKKRFVLVLTMLLTLALLVSACGSKKSAACTGDPIKLGGIFDLSGGTADVGKPYADGVKAYVDYVNTNGGCVNGRPIKLFDNDYAYQVPQAQEIYKKLVETEKVVAIMGWGTGDTTALSPQIAKDKIPYISGSLAEDLLDINKAPYNFLVAPSYSDQARLALQWIKEQKPNAKIAFIYNNSAFGTSPIADAKAYVEKNGMTWVGQVEVPLTATEANSQMLQLKQWGADYALIQETSGATATSIKDAKKNGLSTQLIGLNWAADELPVKLAASSAEGFMGVIPFAFPTDESLAGMKDIKSYLDSKGQKLADKSQKFIQGWVSAKIMVEAMKKAGNDVNGETIRKGLESLNNLDLGGLAAPVTFTGQSHRGTQQTKLYKVQGGKWVPVTKDYFGFKK